MRTSPRPPSDATSPHSARRAAARFATEHAAARYQQRLVGTARDRREKRCVAKLLEGLAPAARVLDLPCGTGRLTTWLAARGLEVVAADVSLPMVERARAAWRAAAPDRRTPCVVADVLALPLRDGVFDALVCNRLFHHLVEPAIRIGALRELARVCRGPIVLSYFEARSFGALRRRLHDRLRAKVRTDRIPIPLARLEAEAAHTGLAVTGWAATRRWISEQSYVRLERRASAHTS